MARKSGHRPTQRLVARKSEGPHDEVLWDYLPEVPDPASVPEGPHRDATIDERFDAWITRNPQVLDLFIRLARDWKAAGQTRAGGKMFAEVLRYHSVIEGTVVARDDQEAFKINNVYVSRLTRLAVQTAPDLDGLFEFRELTSLRSA